MNQPNSTYGSYVSNTTYWVVFDSFSFSGKERDEETDYSNFGARYYDAELTTTWLSVDPMADKYPSLSPYAYCAWNPVKLVDLDGEDIYHFNNDGSFSHKTKARGPHKGEIMHKGETVSFSFADPVNDPLSIDEGIIQKLEIVTDDKVKEYLSAAGVYDMKGHGWKDKISYLINESNASNIKGTGKLDYVISVGQHGLDPSTLYMTKTDGGNVAHNNYNFGNFLWGASVKELGVVSIVARGAAHINNFFNDCENVTRKFWERKFDSKDDQRSIKLGIKWAKKN